MPEKRLFANRSEHTNRAEVAKGSERLDPSGVTSTFRDTVDRDKLANQTIPKTQSRSQRLSETKPDYDSDSTLLNCKPSFSTVTVNYTLCKHGSI
jgi:hypothetical protein